MTTTLSVRPYRTMGAEKVQHDICECRELLRVAILEVPTNKLIDDFYRRWLPIVHGESLLSSDCYGASAAQGTVCSLRKLITFWYGLGFADP